MGGIIYDLTVFVVFFFLFFRSNNLWLILIYWYHPHTPYLYFPYILNNVIIFKFQKNNNILIWLFVFIIISLSIVWEFHIMHLISGNFLFPPYVFFTLAVSPKSNQSTHEINKRNLFIPLSSLPLQYFFVHLSSIGNLGATYCVCHRAYTFVQSSVIPPGTIGTTCDEIRESW